MRLAVIPGILLAFVACGGSDNSAPTEARMNFTNTALVSASQNKNTITMPPGGRVHYFNTDQSNHHQAVSPGAGCEALNSKDLAPGEDDLRPAMVTDANCTVSDGKNAAINATVFVQTPPPGSTGQGGY